MKYIYSSIPYKRKPLLVRFCLFLMYFLFKVYLHPSKGIYKVESFGTRAFSVVSNQH